MTDNPEVRRDAILKKMLQTPPKPKKAGKESLTKIQPSKRGGPPAKKDRPASQ